MISHRPAPRLSGKQFKEDDLDMSKTVGKGLNMLYFAIIYDAERRAEVDSYSESQLWSSRNPNGITFQEICDGYGRIAYQGNDKEEAERIVRVFKYWAEKAGPHDSYLR